MYNPDEDGITHINVYSKGKTELGRFLSNFSYFPIKTEDGCFDSVEGYWYWLSCKDDNLRKMSGYQAKDYGRKHGGKDWLSDDNFKRKITSAIEIKIKSNQYMYDKIKKCNLPFTHYYVYGSKLVNVPEAKWILDCINNLRYE